MVERRLWTADFTPIFNSRFLEDLSLDYLKNLACKLAVIE